MGNNEAVSVEPITLAALAQKNTEQLEDVLFIALNIRSILFGGFDEPNKEAEAKSQSLSDEIQKQNWQISTIKEVLLEIKENLC